MQQDLDKLIVDRHLDINSKEAAIADWTCLGLRAGNRISEYGQSNIAGAKLGHHARDPVYPEQCVAFSIDDFQFFKGKQAIPIESIATAESAATALAKVDRVELNWSTQKNGNRNEKIDFNSTPANVPFCPVRRAISIVRRFHRLLGFQTRNYPLGVYRRFTGQVYNITRLDVDQVIKACAIRVHGLQPDRSARDKATLAAFRSHSIRVGATNILFGNGVPASIIQKRLRWRSDSYLLYFRNIGILSSIQADAVEAALQNPELF